MAARIRAFDWSRHPLGPVERWPQSLKTVIRVMLSSRYAMWLGWGEPCYFFCNDACLPAIGNNEGPVLGEPARTVWHGIWRDIRPRAASVWETGLATRDDSVLLLLDRLDYVEETYSTFSYSPVPDDHGTTGGLLCVVTDDTDRVIGERRLDVLRALTAELAAETTERGVLNAVRWRLARESRDLPFALVYLFERDGACARLACSHGVVEGSAVAPAAIDAGASGETWPAGKIAGHAAPLLMRNLAARFNHLPCTPWSRPPRDAVALPLGQAQGAPLGFVVAGLNPHRNYDSAYRSFLELFVSQIAARLALTRALENRVSAESVAHENDRRHREIVQNLPAAVYTCDAEGRITFYNAAAVALWGRTPDPATDRWCGSHRIRRPDGSELPLDACPMAVALREGRPVYGEEIVIERPDGSERHVLPYPTPIHDADGRVAGAVNMLLDVTDRRRTERALQESEQRTQTLLAMLPAGVYACDARGRITFFNRRAAELWGREPLLNDAADLYCPFQSVTLPDGRRVAAEHTPMALAVREGMAFRDIELAMQRADGTTFDASVSIEPLLDSDGRPAGAIKLFHDISERVRAANALRDSEARLRLATASGKVGIWDWDIISNRFEWSDSLFRIHHIMREQFEPTLEGFAALVHPDDRARVIAALRSALDADAPLELEFRTLRRDSDVVWILTNAVVVRSAGRPVRMLGAALDVTDLKRSERALLDADQRKDEFLATLAHELRNPLAPIRNAVQVLSRDDVGAAANAAAREIMARQLGHMVHLIDDLLDVSRITRGKIQLRTEMVDLAVPVQNALEASQFDISRHGHHLTTSLASERLWVRADVTRLGQVFTNLLNNAAKYTEAGGAIHVAVARAGDEGIVTVKDSGVGIPPAMQPKVFEMFTQVDRSLGRSEGGLGIGLAIARRLVELHGGSVEIQSAGQDFGSEFTVRLPLVVEAEPARTKMTAPAHERAPTPVAPRKVLVVDDNRDAADSLAMMLGVLGHDTCTAYDGLEAIEAAGSRRPDVVLLDIGMPKLNGYDACRRIRQAPGGDEIVIVALTGWGQTEDRRRSREAGFDHHLVKPVEPEALESILLHRSRPAADGA